MYQEIQKCKRQGLLKVETSRKLHLDIGTVAKYYDMSETEYLERQQSNKYRDKAFDPLTYNPERDEWNECMRIAKQSMQIVKNVMVQVTF